MRVYNGVEWSFLYFFNAGTFSISLGRGGSDPLKTLMTYDEITARSLFAAQHDAFRLRTLCPLLTCHLM